ncbi:hypothetical protein KJ966_04800 [bacterium]|nr:hypothetical protein [bacterium]
MEFSVYSSRQEQVVQNFYLIAENGFVCGKGKNDVYSTMWQNHELKRPCVRFFSLYFQGSAYSLSSLLDCLSNTE